MEDVQVAEVFAAWIPEALAHSAAGWGSVTLPFPHIPSLPRHSAAYPP